MITCKDCGWKGKVSELEYGYGKFNCPNCNWILGYLDPKAVEIEEEE